MGKKEQKTAMAKADPPVHDSKCLRVGKQDHESEAMALARTVVTPELASATIIRSSLQGAYGAGLADVPITELLEQLRASTISVNAGDMQNVEGMLVAQATALNVLFAQLIHRATINIGQHLDAMDTYMRLALRT